MARGKKTGGRDKGTPNKLTSETRNIIHSLLSEELPNLRKYISQVEKPELKAKLLIDLLPYDLPKYHTIQLTSKTEEQIIIRFKDAM
jgi:hypothetical protein